MSPTPAVVDSISASGLSCDTVFCHEVLPDIRQTLRDICPPESCRPLPNTARTYLHIFGQNVR